MVVIIARLGEMFLKSERTKRRFEKLLLKNVRQVMGKSRFRVETGRGRLYIHTRSRTAVRRLTMVPGIVSLSPAMSVPPSVEKITLAAVELARKTCVGKSFAVRSKCVEAGFSDRRLNETVGRAILEKVPNTRVDLDSPDVEIGIEVTKEAAYIFTEKIEGAGGLPVGSEGSVVSICDERSNSVISTWLVMKRGCRVFPLVLSNLSKKWLKKLLQPMSGFYLQMKLRETADLAVALRLAGILGRKVGALAVVSMESLDELENTTGLDSLCDLPVLRPLVGMAPDLLEEYAKKLQLPSPSLLHLKRVELRENEIRLRCEHLLQRVREISFSSAR